MPGASPERPTPPPPAVAKLLYEAHTLKMKYRLDDAAKLYKKILTQHPNLSPALAGLGHTVGTAGRLRVGIELLREAVSLDEHAVEPHLYLGELIFHDHDPTTAIEHLEKVLAVEPKRAEALTLAASCMERLNKIPEARAYADRAVAAKRNDPEANLMLAKLESMSKEFDAARARLGKLISKRTTPPSVHHRALTELGFLLDKIGEYDAAYDAFDKAGQEIASTSAVKRINPDLANLRIDAYRGRVSRGTLGRFAGENFDTPAPAFLVGFPRSGTTMTEQILAAHPGIVTSDERPLMDPLCKKLMEGATECLDVPARLDRLDANAVAELRRVYWQSARALFDVGTDNRLFVDKLPLNIIDLAMINAIFPDARVLVALRDPRDVCLSCFMQWLVPNPAMIQLLSLPSAVSFYEAVMSLYLELRGELSVPVLQVRYEDTVTGLEAQARRIIDHLGLEWHDDLLNFQEKAKQRTIRTPSYSAVTEKVHTRAVGRWKNYSGHFEPLQDRLAPFVSEFGY